VNVEHTTCTRRKVNATCFLYFVFAAVVSQPVDYCDWETFNATCPADQVISIISARYGRMKLATKCVSLNYGNIGCGADVTSYLEATCSGNRACALSVISLSQISLPTNAPCPSDLKYYLEAEYECLKGEATDLIINKCCINGSNISLKWRFNWALYNNHWTSFKHLQVYGAEEICFTYLLTFSYLLTYTKRHHHRWPDVHQRCLCLVQFASTLLF